MQVTLKNYEKMTEPLLAYRSVGVWLDKPLKERQSYRWTTIHWEDGKNTTFCVRQTKSDNIIVEEVINEERVDETS